MTAARKAAKRLPPPPVKTPNNARSFRPDIEGLRAIAVVMVMLNHAGVAALSGGYIGVDVFFVLSGFLITGILVREVEQSGTISLKRFYARRARRLLPAGALVLISTVVASHFLIGGARSERIATDAKWTALFLSNFRFIRAGHGLHELDAAAFPGAAFLVAGGRGAVLCRVAAAIDCGRVLQYAGFIPAGELHCAWGSRGRVAGLVCAPDAAERHVGLFLTVYACLGTWAWVGCWRSDCRRSVDFRSGPRPG